MKAIQAVTSCRLVAGGNNNHCIHFLTTKKFVLLSMLLIAGAFTNAVFASVTIKVDAGIGKAKQDCGGFSICKITITIGPSSATLSDDQSILTLDIDAAALADSQPDKVQYFSGKKTVTFDEDWIAPTDMNRAPRRR